MDVPTDSVLPKRQSTPAFDMMPPLKYHTHIPHAKNPPFSPHPPFRGAIWSHAKPKTHGQTIFMDSGVIDLDGDHILA